MELIKAITLSLGEVTEPVITRYRIGVILHLLYLTKVYNGETLKRLGKDYATGVEFNKILATLKSTGIIRHHRDFPEKVFLLLGHTEADANELACAIDPFCYVSHLSAMSYHGITNRLPMKLFITGPDPKQWRQESEKQMAKDLGDKLEIYKDGKMPLLIRPKMLAINRVEIHRYNSLHHGAFKHVKGKTLRVSTIGRTFLDMLRKPEICGGMQHIMEIWEAHANTYIDAIVNEIDQHGEPIEKVRAGYLLTEKLQITHPTVDGWTRFAVRGGSRKLDPATEYAPRWSEKWCISINL